MLKRIRVKGYKSLEDVEVVLSPLSVLFGPNAAGKSNFLDALQLLSGIVNSRNLTEAFNPPYRGKILESFTFGREGTRGLLDQNSVTFSIEADVELSEHAVEGVNRRIVEMRAKPSHADGVSESSSSKIALVREKYLRYGITLEMIPKTGVLRVADESLRALRPDGEPKAGRPPFLEKVGERLHVRGERQSHPLYMECYLDHSILSTPLYPPHFPHLVAMREELATWHFYYLEPRERMRSLNPVKEVRYIGLMGEELAAFFNTLKAENPKQFSAMAKALHLIVPSISGIDVDINDIGEVELKLLEEGTPVAARILSEGTLRVLGLLALRGVKEPPGLIGFEEPENGIHPRRIRLVADLLKNMAKEGKSQLVVTTHSPVLIDEIATESLYVCRRTQRRTLVERFKTWGELNRQAAVLRGFEDEKEIPVSARILRGDFDA